MGALLTILGAEDGTDVGRYAGLIVLILIGVISLIAKLAERFLRKQAEKAELQRQQELRRRSQEQPAPATVQPIELEPVRVGVADEVAQPRRRPPQQKLRGRRRLAARKPPEEDTAAIEQRILHVPGAPGAPGTIGGPPRQLVDLRGREKAREAIVLLEILSAPKALRQQPEPWDL